MHTPIYPLSADPITDGHIDIVKRILKQEEGNLVIAIGNNADKKYMFSMPERVQMVHETIARQLDATLQDKVDVIGFSGLLTDFAYRHGYKKVYRGIRNGADHDFEALLHEVNETQSDDIDTVPLHASKKYSHISSSVVKAILKDQGQIHTYVPLHIKQALEARMLEQYPISISGSIGTGKSYVADDLVAIGKRQGITVHNIDMDSIGHKILHEYTDYCYTETKKKLIEAFGDITDEEGNISRKKLGAIVFSDEEKIQQLNTIMAKPLKFAIRDSIKGKKGIILYNGALIPDWSFQVHSNNNTILLHTDEQTQIQRIMDRNLVGQDEAEKRIARQKNTIEKKNMLDENSKKYARGSTLMMDNTASSPADREKLFEDMLETIDIYGELRIGRTLQFLGINIPVKEFIAQFKNKEHYDNDNRAYHNWQHIIDCMNKLLCIKHLIPDERTYHLMVLAFIGHDNIYLTNASNGTGEIESADSIGRILEKHLSKEEVNMIQTWILDTKHQGEPKTDMGKFFADIDMSILGSDRKKYHRYAKGIRQEFSQYNDTMFTMGRASVLRKFLQQPIFYSSHFHSLYDTNARKNIEKEIILLERK